MKPPWEWRQSRLIASAIIAGLWGGIVLLLLLLKAQGAQT